MINKVKKSKVIPSVDVLTWLFHRNGSLKNGSLASPANHQPRISHQVCLFSQSLKTINQRPVFWMVTFQKKIDKKKLTDVNLQFKNSIKYFLPFFNIFHSCYLKIYEINKSTKYFFKVKIFMLMLYENMGLLEIDTSLIIFKKWDVWRVGYILIVSYCVGTLVIVFLPGAGK